MLDERDVLNKWRSLFTGQEITSDSLTKGSALLNGLSGESPLHLRLAKELEDVKALVCRRRSALRRRGSRRSDITRPLLTSVAR